MIEMGAQLGVGMGGGFCVSHPKTAPPFLWLTPPVLTEVKG